MNKFSKEKFEQVAAENGYEVFTAEDIASYYKEGIQKSLNEQMSENEKKEFVADCMSLAKAILVDDKGNESTVYYRKSQVNWEKAEDGTIMKGVAGVYADTPTNRLLGRVGEAYIPDADFMKSLDSEENEIAKAARTGRYADTPENRRLHRVGQPYKKRASKGGQEGEEKPAGKKNEGGKLDEKTLKDAWDSIRTIDDEGSWDDAIREHFGDEVADSVYDKDGDLVPKKMFRLVKKLPADVVKRCIEEAGVLPEDGEQPQPKDWGGKRLPSGWKNSIRVVDDEDSWNAALEDAMGSEEYDKVFTEDLAQDEDAWFKKMEEMVPKYMSPKQVKELIEEVGTDTEDGKDFDHPENDRAKESMRNAQELVSKIKDKMSDEKFFNKVANKVYKDNERAGVSNNSLEKVKESLKKNPAATLITYSEKQLEKILG